MLIFMKILIMFFPCTTTITTTRTAAKTNTQDAKSNLTTKTRAKWAKGGGISESGRWKSERAIGSGSAK